MEEIKKMLRAVINGQSAMKAELLGEIKKNRTEINRVDEKVDSLKSEMKQEFAKTNKRIDKLGLSLAELEDDAPTIEEFDNLEKRVIKLENKFASA